MLGALHGESGLAGAKHAQAEVTAWVRTIFAQPDRGMERIQPELVAAYLEKRFPKVAGYLREAGEDVLSRMAFPPDHWRWIHFTNPLERTLTPRSSVGNEAERVYNTT